MLEYMVEDVSIEPVEDWHEYRESDRTWGFIQGAIRDWTVGAIRKSVPVSQRRVLLCDVSINRSSSSSGDIAVIGSTPRDYDAFRLRPVVSPRAPTPRYPSP